jgi:hypothetical protein
MEKSNQQPKTQGCLAEGEPVDLGFYRVERPSRSVPRETREPQAGPASCLSNSASKVLAASGDGVCLSEPNTERPATGEGLESLPGSKSVARAEGDARNRGGPERSRRTNCASQAGRYLPQASWVSSAFNVHGELTERRQQPQFHHPRKVARRCERRSRTGSW